jgi:hypothetical protein
MNLHLLTGRELDEAYEAADFLCKLQHHLDPILFIKLDTFRADVLAEMEDRSKLAQS